MEKQNNRENEFKMSYAQAIAHNNALNKRDWIQMFSVVCELREKFLTDSIPFDPNTFFKISTQNASYERCMVDFSKSDNHNITVDFIADNEMQTAVINIDELTELGVYILE